MIQLLAATIFILSFIFMALGRFGKIPLRRGPIALVGGLLTMMIFDLSWKIIELEIIALLLGLMVIAGLSSACGTFDVVRSWLSNLSAKKSLQMSILLMAVTSAALLNDAAVIVLIPILLPILVLKGLRASTCVVLLALAANIGSLLTPFGNPQNAVLAKLGDLNLFDFLVEQFVWVLLGLGILLVYSNRVKIFEVSLLEVANGSRVGSVFLGNLAIASFLLLAVLGSWVGLEYGVSALLVAVVFYVVLRVGQGSMVDRLAVRAVDWNVLMLFPGLYLLTGGIPFWFPTSWLFLESVGSALHAMILVLGLSNFVGNVPAILTFAALDAEWTSRNASFLVTVSTLGGSLLLTGSAASLIAADVSRKLGFEVGFVEFMRIAVPLILPVLILAGFWMW